MFVPFSAPGITVERSVPTRSAVACSAGPVVAIALKKAVVPALLIWTGVTAATPGVCETSLSRVCSRGSLARGSLPAEPWELAELLEELAEPLEEPAEPPEEPAEPPEEPAEPWEPAELLEEEGCAGEPSDTAISSGPFTPAPKLSEIRSYARRAVVEVDSAATSFCPRVSDSNGTASGIRIASAASVEITGRLTTPAAHRAHNPCFGWAGRWRPRTRSALIRGPMIASIAGSRVSAARTATTTATAAISPIVVTSGMPATASDTSA